MFSKAFSGAINGIDGLIICVEADVSDGIPSFDMVGLLGSEVKEARERVRISLKNSGFRLPPKRITINLSPAHIRKEGTAFDLPIAIAILTSFGYLSESNLLKTLIIGELSLNGDVNKVSGILPIIYSAKIQGYLRCIVPIDNVKEGAVVGGIDVIGVENLTQAVKYLNNELYLDAEYVNIEQLLNNGQAPEEIDFCDITGQDGTKRAMEVAVTGMHNILMIGPPGSGKTMIAKRIPGIMPDISIEESIEISKIYSISGLLDNNMSLILKRPFRAPHHTITSVALVGGGRIPKPGEISLASKGVLFLDELPEFNKSTIEILRQPLEDKYVTIARNNGTYRYPTNFMLVAAMNPCRCGYYPDRNICNCSINEVRRYLNKISQPLIDRIDICIETIQINYKDLESKIECETSSAIKERVMRARNIQLLRYKDETFNFNSELTSRNIDKYCKLGKPEQKLLEQAFIKLNLSARAYHRILKVARTIADLDDANEISKIHLSEAICYRSLDQQYWGNDRVAYD